jgi:hypothetical protein
MPIHPAFGGVGNKNFLNVTEIGQAPSPNGQAALTGGRCFCDPDFLDPEVVANFMEPPRTAENITDDLGAPPAGHGHDIAGAPLGELLEVVLAYHTGIGYENTPVAPPASQLFFDLSDGGHIHPVAFEHPAFYRIPVPGHGHAHHHCGTSARPFLD